MEDTCAAQGALRNSAKAALDEAHNKYMSCLPLEKRQEEAIRQGSDQISLVSSEADQLDFMTSLLLKQLAGEIGSDSSIKTMKDLASTASADLQKQMEDIKRDIRLEKRIFLDSEPQKKISVGGLYFTKVPDNQVLIAFLSCFGTFLLCAGLLVLFNKIPWLYFKSMTMNNRVFIVSTTWISVLILMYVCFFVFT
jgi:hypothetical protein